MRTTRERIGTFGVDSGQVLIIDPCYIKPTWNDEYDDVTSDYRQICEVTDHENGSAGPVKHLFAVASQTGYGDGSYPVFATKNHEGRIVKLEIYFDRIDGEYGDEDAD